MSIGTGGDGWETSLLLHFRPDVVRPGYQQLPHAPSSTFVQAIMSGDRAKNPSGIGGFPTHKASAEIGQRIAAYRASLIGDAVLGLIKARSEANQLSSPPDADASCPYQALPRSGVRREDQ